MTRRKGLAVARGLIHHVRKESLLGHVLAKYEATARDAKTTRASMQYYRLYTLKYPMLQLILTARFPNPAS